MHIAFRADASIQIGTGHVMRCLTLADALRARGARCTFICRPHSGHLMDVISQRGHRAVALPSLAPGSCQVSADPAHAAWLGIGWEADAQEASDALRSETVDWLVVDHYALDKRWEHALRPHCKHIIVIDDLADRPHDCDMLLDQNLGRSARDYGGLLKPHTATFIGPQYALLRPEFDQLRDESLARRSEPQLKHLLITMGGVDKGNATGQVLQALRSCNLPSNLRITVVMGSQAPYFAAVQALAEKMPWATQVLSGVNNMAQLMRDSDLCVGAAGGTAWERCCLGLPTLLLTSAENQISGAAALERVGAVQTLNAASDLPQVFGKVLSDGAKAYLESMSRAAARITNGHGTARIATAMLTERLHA